MPRAVALCDYEKGVSDRLKPDGRSTLTIQEKNAEQKTNSRPLQYAKPVESLWSRPLFKRGKNSSRPSPLKCYGFSKWGSFYIINANLNFQAYLVRKAECGGYLKVKERFSFSSPVKGLRRSSSL